ncbi:unnamed protein product [Bursaphelenchus okinawaensis]|uniref:AMP-binding domain-containing protein n=1 Tax=Bursaphelenchus okinawaensis TaxID=465554 RepID=A0A811L112_9BILA|nr:unnamed protein product [Bursaphelenchus okinawaensis]CAG9114564.1 unnamed protein product [Bursaphelenchus okinawaensis]
MFRNVKLYGIFPPKPLSKFPSLIIEPRRWRATSCQPWMLLMEKAGAKAMIIPYRETHSNKMIISAEHNIEIPNVSIHQRMLENFQSIAKKSPKRKVFINAKTGESVTYGELHRASYCVSAYLKNLGFRQHDVCAVVLRNTWEFFAIWYGICLRGGAMTPASPLFTEAEIAQQLKDSNSKVVVCEAITLPRVIAAADQCKTIQKIIVVGSYYGIKAPNLAMFKDILQVKPNFRESYPRVNLKTDICYLPYSSGTTGPPKGVMHSYQNVMTMTEIFSNYFRTGIFANLQTHWNFDNENFPGLLPFYHNFGFIAVMSVTLLGGTVVYLNKFEPEAFFDMLQNYKIKVAFMVPPMLVLMSKTPMLDKYDLNHLRFILSGAAPLSDDLVNMVRKRLPNLKDIGNGYGMTELTCAATSPCPGDYNSKASGKILPNMQFKIADPDTGRSLGVNEEGELCIHSPAQLIGYLNRPKATEEIFDHDGFVRTGDIAYYDENHYIYVVDRRKELIKVKGLQVAPAELEALLLTCNLVKDVAVIGVPHERSGEVPKAYVVKATPSATAQAITDFVKSRVANYKELAGGVEFVDEIPKSPAGKILRRQLRDLEKKKRAKL